MYSAVCDIIGLTNLYVFSRNFVFIRKEDKFCLAIELFWSDNILISVSENEEQNKPHAKYLYSGAVIIIILIALLILVLVVSRQKLQKQKQNNEQKKGECKYEIFSTKCFFPCSKKLNAIKHSILSKLLAVIYFIVIV